MFSSQIATIDLLQSVAFGSISTTYTKLGSVSHVARLVCLTNLTDGDMLIAYTQGATPLSDGTQDNLIIPAGAFKLFDIATNRMQTDSAFACLPGGTFWVRYSTAPTKKAMYLENIYGVGE